MDDDQTWLDALAGRGGAPSATVREALALRAALGARVSPAAHSVASLRNAPREEALIARAVREGVIERAARPARSRSSWQLPLAAGVLLMFGAGIFLMQFPSMPDVVRGDADGIVRLRAADPAALKREILAQLRAAGIEATGYEALDVQGIDADLPQPLTAAVRDVLAAHGIAEPANGVLRIEIRSSE